MPILKWVERREREYLYFAVADRYTIEEPRCNLTSSTTKGGVVEWTE
jgi:hypothetical protein